MAIDDHATTSTNQSILIHPLGNDFDPDPGDHIHIARDGLRLLHEDPASGGGASVPAATGAGLIALAALADGPGVHLSPDHLTIDYVPSPSFSGTTTIRYVIEDDHGAQSRPAIITVAVERGGPPPNQPPVAENDSGPLVQVGATPIAIDVLANDHDPDGDPLSIVVPGAPPETPLSTLLGGTVTADGQHVVYTPPSSSELPDPDQPGRLVDHFTYTIDDGQNDPGHQATAEVTVPLNRAPEAMNDLAPIEGHSVDIAVLTNDRDPDGELVDNSQPRARGPRHRRDHQPRYPNSLHARRWFGALGGQLHLHDRRRPGRSRHGDGWCLRRSNATAISSDADR